MSKKNMPALLTVIAAASIFIYSNNVFCCEAASQLKKDTDLLEAAQRELDLAKEKIKTDCSFDESLISVCGLSTSSQFLVLSNPASAKVSNRASCDSIACVQRDVHTILKKAFDGTAVSPEYQQAELYCSFSLQSQSQNVQNISCEPTQLITKLLLQWGANQPINVSVRGSHGGNQNDEFFILNLIDTPTVDCRESCKIVYDKEAALPDLQKNVTLKVKLANEICPSACAQEAGQLKCNCLGSGKDWNPVTNQCCQDVPGGNIPQCKCEANPDNKWNPSTGTCERVTTGGGLLETKHDKDDKGSGYNSSSASEDSGSSQNPQSQRPSNAGSKSSSEGTTSSNVPAGGKDGAQGRGIGSGISSARSTFPFVVSGSGGLFGTGSKKDGAASASGGASTGSSSGGGGFYRILGISSKDSEDIFKFISKRYKTYYAAGIVGYNENYSTKKLGKVPVIYGKPRKKGAKV